MRGVYRCGYELRGRHKSAVFHVRGVIRTVKRIPKTASTVPSETTKKLSTLFKEETTTMANTMIRIRLKAYDHQLIDSTAEKIVESAKRNGATVSGPIPLPTKKEVVTILRSVHKDKDSREQFERRTHKRLIDILNPNAKCIEALQGLDLPAGVEIEIKL